MKTKQIAGISRREAFRKMLGYGSLPLAMSWMNQADPVVADGFFGNNDSDIVRVEEDWYVKVGTPSPADDSPQITTVISPSWTLWGWYAVFDMNCATQPGFFSGGVQLQLWRNGVIQQTRSNTNWASLSTVDEDVRYTSAVAIENANLAFEIINGTGTTWGTFGTGELKMSVSTWRNDLNFYGPWFSESNSRIGFASHRVRRFILERVRYIKRDGTVTVENDPRVLHYYDPAA